MKTEIEVKFLNINIDGVREKLKAVGAELEQPMRLMRREVFHLVKPDVHAYVRVRDEGHKATLTFKRFEGDGLHAAKEAETEVGDFETATTILKEAGLVSKSYQETKRETWRAKQAEVVIDEWPWAPPYIEIEGSTEEAVRQTAADLGFDWREAVFGGVATVYRALYPAVTDDQTINDLPRYDFDAPVPDEFGERHGS